MIKFRGHWYDREWLSNVFGIILGVSLIVDKARAFDELLRRVRVERQKTSRLRRLGRRIRASLN